MTTKNVGRVDGQSLQLKKFELSSIKPHATICMIAKRDSGKSWVIRDILYHKKDIPGGVVISLTDSMSKFFDEFFPPLYIHYDYDQSIINNVLLRQRTMLKKLEEKKLTGKTFDPSAVLIMDDCMVDPTIWRKDKLIKEIFVNGRHFKLTFIMAMQYCLDIAPALRMNMDYVFLMMDDTRIGQKKLYEQYAGQFPSFNSFLQAFKVCTSDFGCMVINNKIKSMNLEDKIFWYKAEERGKFDFGCKQFRDFSVSNFDPLYDERPAIFDINTLKKNEQKIFVEKLE